MKRILLSLLAIVVVLGLFAAVGFAGYRVGYMQGARTTTDGNVPQLRQFDNDGPDRLPQRDFGFERRFERGFGMRGFPMMGFGFFSPLLWLGRILVLGLIIWFIYWLATRSGWRLTRTVSVTTPPPAAAAEDASQQTDVNQ